ncbi:MAG: DUF3822 family protein [Rikenellaceae bacterium]|jgi:hypothetical protein|nr:DUF3822 family protein [Rikenellaceae bacterium]
MQQENNLLNNRLSIRITPDGFSFFVAGEVGPATVANYVTLDRITTTISETPALQHPFAQVCASWETHKACLVPSALFDHRQGDIYLALNGTPHDDMAETVIHNPQGNEAIFVYAVDLQAKAEIERHFPGLDYTHPLLELLTYDTGKSNLLLVEQTIRHAFLVLRLGGRLTAAEALPCAGFADLLLAVNRIIVAGKAGRIRIRCYGTMGDATCRELSRYFPEVETVGMEGV